MPKKKTNKKKATPIKADVFTSEYGKGQITLPDTPLQAPETDTLDAKVQEYKYQFGLEEEEKKS